MNHHENAGHANMNDTEECCGAGCCDNGACVNGGLTAGYILQWVFLGGAFLCSLLTLLFLPKIVKNAIIHDQALKAGGEENYEKLSKEIYETQDYKAMMKSQVDLFIEQNKATIQMYKSQQAAPQAEVDAGTGTTGTGN